MDSSCVNFNVGQPATTEEIEAMMGDASGPINFTVFLTLMADKLADTDPENTILKAFSAFEDNRNGKINAQYLRECMTTMGDRFTDEEVWLCGKKYQYFLSLTIVYIFRWILCLKAQSSMRRVISITETLSVF